jgi:hypothetical protein
MRYSVKSLLLLLTLAAVTAALIGTRGVIGAYYAWWFWAIVTGLVAVGTGRGLSAVVAMAMFAGGVLGWPVVYVSAHPVSMSRLGRVQIGMTEQEVHQALGSPASVEGGRWVYSGPTWCYVTIVFSDEGRVAEVVHDH